MSRRNKEVKDLKNRVKELEAKVGILSNAEQYNRARWEAGREMAKIVYDFLITRDQFRDWCMTEHTIKHLDD